MCQMRTDKHFQRLSAAVPWLLLCLVACTSRPRLDAKLLGKWQSEANKVGRAVQFEFLSDGTVIENERLGSAGDGKWRQLGTGTFKFIDPKRVKVELQPSWAFGTSVYEVVWQDNDHVGLRAGDETVQLTRVR